MPPQKTIHELHYRKKWKQLPRPPPDSSHMSQNTAESRKPLTRAELSSTKIPSPASLLRQQSPVCTSRSPCLLTMVAAGRESGTDPHKLFPLKSTHRDGGSNQSQSGKLEVLRLWASGDGCRCWLLEAVTNLHARRLGCDGRLLLTRNNNSTRILSKRQSSPV